MPDSDNALPEPKAASASAEPTVIPEEHEARALKPHDEWPAFAKLFPTDLELTKLMTAFQQGNYAFVRTQAPRLAASTKDPRVADAARELRKRIDPDPLALLMLLGAVVLLIVLAAWTLAKHHHP